MKPKSKKTTKNATVKTEAASTVTPKTLAAPAVEPLKRSASPAPAPTAIQAPPVAVVKPSPVLASTSVPAIKPQPPVSKSAKVTLELVKPGASRVLVAGSFNGWKPETTPLTALGNGRWAGSLDVKPGKYEYLFVVDGSWIPDPNATESVTNPYGGLNSVLTVNN